MGEGLKRAVKAAKATRKQKPWTKAEELAHEITAMLFVNGCGEEAERLVLELPNKRNGGGWGYKAVLDRVQEIIEKHSSNNK